MIIVETDFSKVDFNSLRLISERHGFCSQLVQIYYPMKELQLWLASAFICCALMGQAPNEPTTLVSSAEAGSLFSFFTVTPQNGQALLRWAAPPVKSEDFFIIEKSMDALHFETLSAMDASVGLDSVYSMVDNAVGNGTIYYRIRISGKDGREYFSKTVNMCAAHSADFRFYPNPVDKLLIIRSSHPLSVQVMDGSGVIRFAQEVEAGMHIVNVSALQKGNYVLKATDKANNTVVSEELVKNN
jgi:Secretion system C-terminal sorting domain